MDDFEVMQLKNRLEWMQRSMEQVLEKSREFRESGDANGMARSSGACEGILELMAREIKLIRESINN